MKIQENSKKPITHKQLNIQNPREDLGFEIKIGEFKGWKVGRGRERLFKVALWEVDNHIPFLGEISEGPSTSMPKLHVNWGRISSSWWWGGIWRAWWGIWRRQTAENTPIITLVTLPITTVPIFLHINHFMVQINFHENNPLLLEKKRRKKKKQILLT